jgi:hypothetical protein
MFILDSDSALETARSERQPGLAALQHNRLLQTDQARDLYLYDTLMLHLGEWLIALGQKLKMR